MYWILITYSRYNYYWFRDMSAIYKNWPIHIVVILFDVIEFHILHPMTDIPIPILAVWIMFYGIYYTSHTAYIFWMYVHIIRTSSPQRFHLRNSRSFGNMGLKIAYTIIFQDSINRHTKFPPNRFCSSGDFSNKIHPNIPKL